MACDGFRGSLRSDADRLQSLERFCAESARCALSARQFDVRAKRAVLALAFQVVRSVPLVHGELPQGRQHSVRDHCIRLRGREEPRREALTLRIVTVAIDEPPDEPAPRGLSACAARRRAPRAPPPCRGPAPPPAPAAAASPSALPPCSILRPPLSPPAVGGVPEVLWRINSLNRGSPPSLLIRER